MCCQIHLLFVGHLLSRPLFPATCLSYLRHRVLPISSGNLPLTFLDSYELKSRKVDEEHKIRKSEFPNSFSGGVKHNKNPLFFER